MKAVRVFILLFLISLPEMGHCASATVIRRWKVYPSSFPAADLNSLRAIGKKNDRQPAANTELKLLASNTDYMELRTSTITNGENVLLLLFQSQGKIEPLSSLAIIEEYDSWRGGLIKYVNPNIIIHQKEKVR